MPFSASSSAIRPPPEPLASTTPACAPAPGRDLDGDRVRRAHDARHPRLHAGHVVRQLPELGRRLDQRRAARRARSRRSLGTAGVIPPPGLRATRLDGSPVQAPSRRDAPRRADELTPRTVSRDRARSRRQHAQRGRARRASSTTISRAARTRHLSARRSRCDAARSRRSTPRGEAPRSACRRAGRRSSRAEMTTRPTGRRTARQACIAAGPPSDASVEIPLEQREQRPSGVIQPPADPALRARCDRTASRRAASDSSARETQRVTRTSTPKAHGHGRDDVGSRRRASTTSVAGEPHRAPATIARSVLENAPPLYSPNTLRMAPHTSPIEARSRRHPYRLEGCPRPPATALQVAGRASTARRRDSP